MQFLIKTIIHDTGEVFHDVIKARENEVFTLVDAECEDEAREMIKPKGLLEVVPSSFNDNPISRALSKSSIYRKDSE